MACRTAALAAEPQRHGFALRPPGASKGSRPCSVSPSMSARESTSAPQSRHTAGSGSRTSTANWVIQPRHCPATVSRRSGDAAGRCAPSRRALNSPPPPDTRPRSCPPPTPASRASGPPRSKSTSSTGSVPWPSGVLEVDPEPAREPRNHSERQFQDRLGGESLPIRPRPGRSGQCARAGVRTRRGPDAAELGADPRDLEERLRPGWPLQVKGTAQVRTVRATAPGPTGRIPDFPEQCVGKDGL